MKKDGIKFGLKKFFLLTISLLFSGVFFTNIAWADDKIDVEYPVGTNLNESAIFDFTNILPGWQEKKTIRVENDSETDDINLFFTIDLKGDKKLAEELKLYVIRVENGSYRIGGPGDRDDLKKADEEELYMDRLSATKGKEYRIKIKFDEDAGNEYQNLEAKFDIEFEIESRVATEDETEEDILTDQGRVLGLTENLPEEEAEVLGENTPIISEEGAGSENAGDVKGTSTTCENTKKLPWVLALIVLAIALIANTWKHVELSDYGWKFDTAGVTALVATWYLLENCHALYWVPLSAIGIGIVVHFALPSLLEMLGRKSTT